jgi:hypothetical protein
MMYQQLGNVQSHMSTAATNQLAVNPMATAATTGMTASHQMGQNMAMSNHNSHQQQQQQQQHSQHHHHQQQQQHHSMDQSMLSNPYHHAHHHHHHHQQMQPMLGAGGNNMGALAAPGLNTSLVSGVGNNAAAMNGATNSDLLLTDIDKEKEKQARENHCEIERRRRVKMAAYFNELCVMVPTCNTLQRKPDKLTILRMASSHMRNLRQAATANSLPPGVNGSSQSAAAAGSNDNAYKPSFLTDQELKHLILEAADGFLFVAQCDSANIIYVSDALQPVLSYLPVEWMNHSLYDFIHPDDLDKVKDQLCTQESGMSGSGSGGRILDLKTGTVKKEGHSNSMRSHMGTRRSFICRVKLGQPTASRHYMDPNYAAAMWSTANGSAAAANSRINRNRSTLSGEATTTGGTCADKSNYVVVHVTGYTKIWPPNSSSTTTTTTGGGSSQQTGLSMIDQNQHQQLYSSNATTTTGGHHQMQQHQQQHHQHPNHHHHHHNQHHVDEHGNATMQQQQQHTNFHLIAIARIQMTSAPSDLINSSNYEFVTRHDQNGLITFVDQRFVQSQKYILITCIFFCPRSPVSIKTKKAERWNLFLLIYLIYKSLNGGDENECVIAN